MLLFIKKLLLTSYFILCFLFFPSFTASVPPKEVVEHKTVIEEYKELAIAAYDTAELVGLGLGKKYEEIKEQAVEGYNKTFAMPVQDPIYTQKFFYGHAAIDLVSKTNRIIYASRGGVVIRAQEGWNGGYGNVVIIQHEDGYRTLYAHLKDIYVSVGDEVEKLEHIGFMGNTGRVRGRTGIHLHFEIQKQGKKYNPISLLK